MKLPSQGTQLASLAGGTSEALSSGGPSAAAGSRGQGFTSPIYTPPFILTPADTVTPNMNNGLIQQVELDRVTTLINLPTNPAAGMFFTLILLQDGSGSRLATFGSGMDFGDEGLPVLTTTLDKYDVLSGLFITASLLSLTILTGFGP